MLYCYTVLQLSQVRESWAFTYIFNPSKFFICSPKSGGCTSMVILHICFSFYCNESDCLVFSLELFHMISSWDRLQNTEQFGFCSLLKVLKWPVFVCTSLSFGLLWIGDLLTNLPHLLKLFYKVKKWVLLQLSIKQQHINHWTQPLKPISERQVQSNHLQSMIEVPNLHTQFSSIQMLIFKDISSIK